VQRLQYLAETVERLFAAERAQMQRLIEAQLRDTRALAPGTVMPLPVVEGSSANESRLPAFGTGAPPGPFADLPLREPSTVPFVFALGSKAIWIGVAAASILVILLGIAAFRMRPNGPRPAGAAASVVRMPPMALTAAPVSADLPTLEVRVAPASATLLLDGEKVQNPLKRPMMPDGRPHQLRVEAPGYHTQSRSLVVEAPMLLEIALVREPDDAAQRRAPQGAESARSAPARRAAPAPARAVARPEPEPPMQVAPEMEPQRPPPQPKIDIVE
jgi:hypothetical protein